MWTLSCTFPLFFCVLFYVSDHVIKHQGKVDYFSLLYVWLFRYLAPIYLQSPPLSSPSIQWECEWVGAGFLSTVRTSLQETWDHCDGGASGNIHGYTYNVSCTPFSLVSSNFAWKKNWVDIGTGQKICSCLFLLSTKSGDGRSEL